MDDLAALEHWLEPITTALSPSARAKLARKLASGLRQRQSARIGAQKNPDGSAYARRKPRRRQAEKTGRIKRLGKMYRVLRTRRFLLSRADASGLSVGFSFSGRIAAIARVHQEGQLAKVGKQGPLYQYPARRLLGLSDDDQAWVIDQVSQHLKNAN